MNFLKDSVERVSFFGLNVMNTTFSEMKDVYSKILDGDSFRTVSTPNTEIVMATKNDNEMREIINSFDIVIPDGIGLVIGSKIRGFPLKERVTGFDSSMALLEMAAERGLGVYFLGGVEGVAKRASEKVSESCRGIRITGFHNGYFKGAHNGHVDSEEDKKIVKEINDSGTDIVFVGMGYPYQDKWIYYNRDKIKAKIAIGNGGVMNILAGDLKDAPKFFKKFGLEWLYRLIKEPKRIKRQMVLPIYLLTVFFDKDSIYKVGENG